MRSLLTAAAISLAFTLFLTPVFLRLFRKWGWAQVIRTPEAIENPSHHAKRGTTTMGGTIFIVGTIVGYTIGTLTGGSSPTASGWLVIWMMVGFGIVGFIDDFMKVRSQRSAGLSGWRKIIGQILVVIPFGIVALTTTNQWGNTPASGFISLFRDIPVLWLFALGPIVGWALYLIWLSLIGIAASNGANLTDGLDGLAAGAGVFVIGAYSLISFWQFKQSCVAPALESSVQGGCYDVANPFDLAVISASFVGALVGFLWWNAPKAKVFMGDVGSMAIGGVIAAMAILTRTELLLVLLAGVFVIAPGSVIVQLTYFKLTRGKRLFLQSPFHHHLEMRGWPESTIVVRMWIIAGLLAVSAVGLFYVEWLTRS
ncbi:MULTISPECIES: phospho-N-acetylmuramoyl-pentapeptide-transferase [Microbacterium]|uniref:Phospho-N-acetylmuramoyl-pentapeptide-transferase n=1 Tax=Microbacterium resistens TaxID=156977 RepID=A0ABY3RT83_9MICO|nr:phospho-N-acetylmuramoyl-pentapeptide-transferase [Microbacterium resistens]MBW1637612.1 phospho-N-acetylmuramoyl-pentapeptide-transferase [Microbacterium resistens]MDA4894195.1 phospho-N-acetylmuramoyl-pentapeptide-transferase [Streptomyces sp. MS2A]UGS27096.1 phospho-N-acetylmuramoyl-pentapeptide-transferase [Microbacterium resistens]